MTDNSSDKQVVKAPSWAIAILIFLAGQTIGASVWAGSIGARLDATDFRVTRNEALLASRTGWEAELARLNVLIAGNARTLDRIEDALDSRYSPTRLGAQEHQP